MGPTEAAPDQQGGHRHTTDVRRVRWMPALTAINSRADSWKISALISSTASSIWPRARPRRLAPDLHHAGDRTGNGAGHFAFCALKFFCGSGRAEEALPLLECDAPAPMMGDVAIRWNLLQARADFLLGRTEASRRELSQARLLAGSSLSPLIGEVLRTEGLVLRDSGDWDGAAEKFKLSLVAAREQNDQLLQALNLVDMSAWRLQAGRFDEAVRLSEEAADFARSVHASRQLQMAVGNAGWAYQGLGDFEHALADFLVAERRAAEIGATRDRVRWLQNAGVASYRLGNLSEARKYDERALRFALTLPNSTDQLANIQANLATLFVRPGTV